VSLLAYTDFTNEACLLAMEEFDNELLIDVSEVNEVLQVEIENDILMQEVYTQERGLRVEFLGIQLDELWSFVGNKQNKQWVWLALNPANRQIVGFHVGGRGAEDAKLFHDTIPIYFRENAAFFSDYWQAYVKAFIEEEHFGVGKHSGLTNYIERFNCTLRQRVSRLVRSALSFSKSIVNHVNAIKHFICAYNLEIKTLQI
jgi:IS1 family transposase